ncbi:uncharacterized protein LOC130656758 [Hydractinia symbiolongicarpus]|uniref:uncharacterized protein LOC130656758 n=1 Tax=Hydractinia symbiolongicarpus TaxID=13093 RepID=UPI00254E200D|nr:uncharacterized protein LOC130656758 [Hydractinia symbiolongicarpus]
MNDVTKLYPNLLSAPAQGADMQEEIQIYRLKKIDDIENYLRNEIKEQDKLAKKFQMHGTWVRFCNHGLLGVSVITSGLGIGAIASGLGIPLAIAMGELTIAAGIGQAGLRNASKRLGVKSKKHEESKLNSVVDLISKAMENVVISDYEYSLISREKERYMLLKEQMRQRFNRIVNSINEQERVQLVAKGRDEGRKEMQDEILKNVRPVQYASAT